MPGAIVAVLICYWYYNTATKLNINPFPWIIGGLIIYYGTKYGWMYAVVKPLAGKQMMGPLLNDLSGAVVGLAMAALFHAKVLSKQPPRPPAE